MLREQTFTASGLKLAAKVYGPDDGKPVLAMHGWLDNAATFDRLIPLLSPSLRIVAIDLPGHGLSEHRSEDATYSVPDAVVDVLNLIHTLGWKRFSIIGHSMGAAIGAVFAGTKPHLVDKLVLLEGLGPLPAEAHEAPERLERAADEEQQPPSRTRLFTSLDDAASRVTQAVPMELSSAKILLERGLKPVDGGLTWRTDPRLRGTTRLRLTEAHVAAFMKRIAAPTLVVLADHGWPVPQEIIELRKSYIAQLKTVPVVGRHHVHLDSPELVAPHVTALLTPP